MTLWFDRIDTERHFTDHAERGYFAIFDVCLNVFDVYRVNVADSFGGFSNCLMYGVINTFSGPNHFHIPVSDLSR